MLPEFQMQIIKFAVWQDATTQEYNIAVYVWQFFPMRKISCVRSASSGISVIEMTA